MRRWWHNPQTALRVSLAVIITGGLFAGSGTYFRDRPSDHDRQWTFLLDTLGLLIAIAGAGLDFRASSRMFGMTPRSGRHRAIAQLLVGAIVGGGACLVLGWVVNESLPPFWRAVFAGCITAGFGAGLAGLLHIGWFSGSEYLERRIAQRSSDDW